MNDIIPQSKSEKCVIYCRTAVAKEGGKINSINSQQRICLLKAKEMGWEVKAIITDEGKSGNNYKRPGLIKLFKLCSKLKVDYLIVTNIARLSRNIPLYCQIRNQLNKQGVSISTSNMEGVIEIDSINKDCLKFEQYGK